MAPEPALEDLEAHPPPGPQHHLSPPDHEQHLFLGTLRPPDGPEPAKRKGQRGEAYNSPEGKTMERFIQYLRLGLIATYFFALPMSTAHLQE